METDAPSAVPAQPLSVVRIAETRPSSTTAVSRNGRTDAGSTNGILTAASAPHKAATTHATENARARRTSRKADAARRIAQTAPQAGPAARERKKPPRYASRRRKSPPCPLKGWSMRGAHRKTRSVGRMREQGPLIGDVPLMRRNAYSFAWGGF
jgi:hypothetical protein